MMNFTETGSKKDISVKEGYELLNLTQDQVISFTSGIPGFEKVNQFCLLVKEEELPFVHLSALGGFNLEFILVNPWFIRPDYNPEISDDDLASIDSPAQNELLVFVMVVVADPISDSTANLMAPVIINTKARKGKQIAIRNFKDYNKPQAVVTAQK